MNNRWIHAFPNGISIKWNMDSSFIVWTHISRSISKQDNFNTLHYKIWNTPPICLSTLFRGHEIHLHIIPILVYVLLNGSVIDIHVGNEHGNSSSKPAQGCLHFSLHWYTWERHKANYSLFSYELIVGQTVLFNLCMAAGQGEVWFQTH